MPSPTKRQSTPLTFTPDDLNSKDGFLTSVWGPSLWMTLHTVSLNYPTHPTATQRKQYKRFFDTLQHVLPCGKCRDNLTSNLCTTRYGAHVFQNRDTLSRWVYDLHKCVNAMLGKDTPVTYTKMRHTYENFRARCGLMDTARSSGNSGMVGGGKGKRRCTPREGGCTVPVTGIKSKCVIRIVPVCTRAQTMKVDRRCVCHRKPVAEKSRRKR